MRHPCESCTKGRGEFQSTHPLRGATRVKSCFVFARKISIHAPLAGCDGGAGRLVWRTGNFNPRTPCGVRLPVEMECCHWNNFNPRTPCGVRLRISINNSLFRRFQSTHPLRGATIVLITVDKIIEISIHAPLAGCDQGAGKPPKRRNYFNPRTPCGVRLIDWRSSPSLFLFQSTHPLRGATCCRECYLRAKNISIHAPLAGCD